MRNTLTTSVLQLFCVLSTVACGTQAPPAAASQQNEVTAEEVVGAYGVHPGERRNHTKGTCALGTFVGKAEAAVYSRSSLFSGRSVPVVARFSLAGGDPEASDAELPTMPRDFLEPALIERTKQGPVRWDMLLTIGEPGDPEDDPTGNRHNAPDHH